MPCILIVLRANAVTAHAWQAQQLKLQSCGTACCTSMTNMHHPLVWKCSSWL